MNQYVDFIFSFLTIGNLLGAFYKDADCQKQEQNNNRLQKSKHISNQNYGKRKGLNRKAILG